MNNVVRMLVNPVDTQSLTYLPESVQKTVYVKNEEGKLVESIQETKQWKIRGPFIQADKRNRNGRIYEGHLCEREINNYNKEYIEPGFSFGCLGHPPTPNTDETKIAHYMSELKWDGQYGMGELVLMDTTCGLIAQKIFESGKRLCVSTRGVGSMAQDGKVNEDWNLISVDLVHIPSGQDCVISAIYESQEWILKGNNSDSNQKVFEQFNKNLSSHGSRNLANDLLDFFSKIQ